MGAVPITQQHTYFNSLGTALIYAELYSRWTELLQSLQKQIMK